MDTSSIVTIAQAWTSRKTTTVHNASNFAHADCRSSLPHNFVFEHAKFLRNSAAPSTVHAPCRYVNTRIFIFEFCMNCRATLAIVLNRELETDE